MSGYRAYVTHSPREGFCRYGMAVPISDRPSEHLIDKLMQAKRKYGFSYRQIADGAGISRQLCIDILSKKQYADFEKYSRIKKAIRSLILGRMFTK